jgi:type IV pilus assembly protein PilM
VFRRKRHYAGLSIEGGAIRYMELRPSSHGFIIARSAKVSVEEGTIAQDRIVNMDRLSTALGSLRTKLGGKFAPSVVVGLPPQDAIIRIVEMPKMNMEDARSAFGWDFEHYFSFPLKDASFDIVPVDVPSPLSDENMSVMIVASRLAVVNGILDMVAKEDARVTAIEPAGIAIVRGVVGSRGESSSGSLILSVGDRSSQIILEYKGNGLVYRTVYVGARSELQGGTSVYEMLMQEVRNSIVFGSSQFRGLSVKEIVLCGEHGGDEGLLAEVQAAFDEYRCHVADPWMAWSIEGELPEEYGWEAAIGLAVRDKS